MTSKQFPVSWHLCCMAGCVLLAFSPARAQRDGFLREQLIAYGYPTQTQEDIFVAMEAPRPIVRSIAIMLVRETKDVAAIPRVAVALGDDDIDVRIDAARTLTALGDNRGIPVLKSIVMKHLPDKLPSAGAVSEVVGRCKELWTILDAVLGLVESGDKSYVWVAEWTCANGRLPIERARSARVLAAVVARPESFGRDVAQHSLDVLRALARNEKDPGVLLEVILRAKEFENKAFCKELLETISRSTYAPAVSRRHASAALSSADHFAQPQPTSLPAPSSKREGD